MRQGNDGGSAVARRMSHSRMQFSCGRCCLSCRIVVVLTDDTDWEEIRELVTESYRILAPKKLTALLD